MPPSPPLGGRYPVAAAIALFGLVPYIVLTTAAGALTDSVARDIGASADLQQLTSGLSNAGYAVGAVVAAYLGQRFVPRRVFLGYETGFVVGSLLATAAVDPAMYVVGRVVQGTTTGLMLVAALPPLVTRFGPRRLPRTAGLVNIGLFGAVAVGPLLGGWVAAADAWRWLFAATAVAGGLGLLAAGLGYDRFGPADPDLQLDVPAIGLAVGATFLPFVATSLLGSGYLGGVSFGSAPFLLPFVAGLAVLVGLVVTQYRKPDALMPVEALSSQLPVTGTVVAMIAGAVTVTLVALTTLYLTDVAGSGPLHTGLLFWPLPVGVLVGAVVFSRLLPTRWLPLLVDAGMATLAAGAAVLLLLDPAHPGPVVGVAMGLLGFGAAASVAPGLFLAALGVAASKLGRAFALVELLRSEAAFAVAPVFVVLAEGRSDVAAGVQVGLLAMVGLALLGLLLALVIPALSGARLRAPDLRAWLEDDVPALPSPVTAVHARPRAHDDSAEPLLPRR